MTKLVSKNETTPAGIAHIRQIVKISLNSCIIFLFALLFFLPVMADESGKDALARAKNTIDYRYYIQGYYLVNSNHPQSMINDGRAFDKKADSLNFDMAEFVATKNAEPGNIGFRVKMLAGEVGKLIHARGLGNPDESFDLTELYVIYNTPGQKNIKFTVGKMVTPMGAEVLEAFDNPNFSRSFLYTYSEPITHTGICAAYSFSDKFSASAYLVNGWDNFSDNNSIKNPMLSLNYAPSDKFFLVLNGMSGPEKDNNNIENRTLFNGVCSFKVKKKTSFLLSYDIGSEQNSTPLGTSAKWNGYSVIGKYDFCDEVSFAARGEKFNDYDGARTGIPQTLNELTLSVNIKISKNIVLRPEYRHDWSNANFFNGGLLKEQSTYGTGLMILW